MLFNVQFHVGRFEIVQRYAAHRTQTVRRTNAGGRCAGQTIRIDIARTQNVTVLNVYVQFQIG